MPLRWFHLLNECATAAGSSLLDLVMLIIDAGPIIQESVRAAELEEAEFVPRVGPCWSGGVQPRGKMIEDPDTCPLSTG